MICGSMTMATVIAVQGLNSNEKNSSLREKKFTTLVSFSSDAIDGEFVPLVQVIR